MSLLPVWFKGLTPELVKKAELELNETPQIRTKALAELKTLISDRNDFHYRVDDNYLLRFLRVKKFDTHKAFQVIRNNQSFKVRHHDLFRLPSDVKKVLDMNCVTVMPYRTQDGSHIIYIRVGKFDPSIAKIDDFIAFYIICAELVLLCEATQIGGAHCVIDCKDVSMQHYTMFLNISFIKFVISSIQECFAYRMNGIHFIRQPFALTTGIRLVRPLMKKKLSERMHMHGDDMKSLHKHIPKELLTQELGGTMEPLDDKEFASYFMGHEDFIRNINQYGKLNI